LEEQVWDVEKNLSTKWAEIKQQQDQVQDYIQNQTSKMETQMEKLESSNQN
jgi:hypothetical protein